MDAKTVAGKSLFFILICLFVAVFAQVFGQENSLTGVVVVVLALMGWMLVKVNDRASRVKMPEPDNSLGIYRKADA